MVSQVDIPSLATDRPLIRRIEGLVQIFTSSQRNFFTSVMAQALQIAGQERPC
jgi:cob(I)alamin adenosyltransferase